MPIDARWHTGRTFFWCFCGARDEHRDPDPVVTALANADIVLSHRVAALEVHRKKDGADLAPETVERMKAALQDLARPYPADAFDGEQPDSVKLTIAKRLLHAHSVIAREALPPEPTEDLLAARQAVANAYTRSNMPGLAERALAGLMDNRLRVQAALEAFRNGRTSGKVSPA